MRDQWFYSSLPLQSCDNTSMAYNNHSLRLQITFATRRFLFRRAQRNNHLTKSEFPNSNIPKHPTQPTAEHTLSSEPAFLAQRPFPLPAKRVHPTDYITMPWQAHAALPYTQAKVLLKQASYKNQPYRICLWLLLEAVSLFIVYSLYGNLLYLSSGLYTSMSLCS